MINQQQIDHFRTFGFVLLPGFLGPERTQALQAEVDRAIRDAYAPTYDERVMDGISGHYLPMASRLTPMSTSLVCDDPVLMDAAEALLGAPVLPSLPEGVLYFAEAGWHDDDGIGVTGVKFATYFDVLDASNGALRFVPCSQFEEGRPNLRAYQRAATTSSPGSSLPAAPGTPSLSTSTPSTRRPGGGTAWPGRSSTWPSPQTKRPGTRRCDGWTVPSSRLSAALTGSGTRRGVTGWRTRAATAVEPPS